MNKGKLKSILNNDNRAFNVERDNSSDLVDKKFIKNLRIKLNYTQVVFSSVLGVSVKTIEKWEQGVVEPRNIVKKLLLLIDKKPELIGEFHSYKTHESQVEHDEYCVSAGVSGFADVQRVKNTTTIDGIRNFESLYTPNIKTIKVDQDSKHCPAW